MPDDQTQQASPEANSGPVSPLPSTPSADDLGSALERIAGFAGRRTEAEPPHTPEPQPVTASDEDEEPEEEPAEPEPVAVARTDSPRPAERPPEGAPEPAPAQPPEKLSRRQQAALDKQREIDDLRGKWERERAEKEKLAANQKAAEQAEQARRQQVLRVIGDDRRYRELESKVARQQATYQEQTDYQRMFEARSFADLFFDEARGQANRRYQALCNNLVKQAEQVAAKPGVDPDAVKANPQFGAVCEHFYEAGARTEREQASAQLAERDERISALEAELRTAKLRAASGGRIPEAGGAGNGSGRMPMPINANASPMAQIAAGLQELEAGKRGRG